MKLYLPLAALLFSSTASFGADLAVKSPVSVAAAAPSYDWTGFYLGAQGGYIWTKSTMDLDAPNVGDIGHSYLDPEGGLFGAYVGYNHQFSNGVVIGLEGDAAWVDASAEEGNHINGYVAADGGDLAPGAVTTSEVKWSAAVRLRAGYAFDRFLPYIAGGLAIARYETYSYDIANFPGSFDPQGLFRDSSSDTYVGWTIGAGFEYAVTDAILIRAEYRYSDYGSYKPGEFNYSAPSLGPLRESFDLKSNDIRVGAAFKF